MPSLRASTRRVTGFLLTAPAALLLLAAVYVAVGIFFVLTDYTLNNEGVLIHYYASWARRDFVPVFFFQRVHPVLCALFAPISAGGARLTLVTHVVVAATTIPMMAATARSLGLRLPNLPAFVVALSPLYFLGGPAGFSNVDGVVGIVLVLYLLCVRRQAFAAGVVVGLLPWVRFELATFSAVMALYALATARARPMLLGMALFPLAYAGAGVFYHQDVLWMARFPGSVPYDAGNPIYQNQKIGLQYLLEPVVAVTPLAALAAAVRLGRLEPLEIVLLAYAALTAVMMNLLPIFHVANFGAMPRYLLHILPALALLVGRVVERWWEGEPPRAVVVLVTALLALWVATRQLDGRATEILSGAYALVLALAWLRAGTLATVAALALAAVGPLLPLRTEVTREATARYLDPILAWLQAHPARGADPIYTNGQLLALFLERRLPRADVHHMAGTDMARELTLLTNQDNGQRDRIRQLCAVDLYGRTVFPPLAPEDLPSDALLALREDVRLPLLLPPATWSSRREMLFETPDCRIARLRPAVAADGPGGWTSPDRASP